MEYCLKKLIYKNTDTAQLCQAKLLITQNKQQEALDIYKEILQSQPNNFAVLKEKANLLFKINENIEKEFFMVLKLSTQNKFEFYLKLGYFYLNKQDWQKSIAVLVKALAENKQSPMTWLGLGKAYYYNKDYQQSRISLNQANVYDHMNPQIWSFLILNALKENQNINLANQCLRELFKLDCKDVKNELVEIADYLFSIQQIPLAEQCYFKAEKLYKQKEQIEQNLKINLKLSECQKMLRKYQAAIMTLRLSLGKTTDKDVINDLQQQVKKLQQLELEANS